MNFYWDYANQKIVQGLNLPQEVTELTVYARDHIYATLYVVQVAASGSNYYELVDAPAGWSPYFGLKQTSALSSGHLAMQGTWTNTASGTYTAVIDLNTTELVAALGSSDDLACTSEFVLVDGSVNHRASTQISTTLKPDVNRGDESNTTGVYVSARIKVRTIDGVKHLCFYDDDDIEYFRIKKPGA